MMTSTGTRPALILAHTDPAYTALAGHTFNRLGWDVFLASDGPEARHLAHAVHPSAVILEADLAEESGWLTCDKLTREVRDLDVFLVADADTPSVRRLASFVGAAAVVRRQDGLQRLLDEVAARRLAVAG
jgi:DNA-binding response OmpR family regulator